MFDLLVTLAVTGVVVTIGVPNFTEGIMSSRMTGETNELIASLTHARSDAIKREVPITLCKSYDGQSCASSGSWATGWIVFSDEGTRGTFDANDEILGSHVTHGDYQVVTHQNFASWISYDRLGRSLGNAGSATGWVAIIDGRGADHARVVSLSRTGHVSVETGYVKAGGDDD